MKFLKIFRTHNDFLYNDNRFKYNISLCLNKYHIHYTKTNNWVLGDKLPIVLT